MYWLVSLPGKRDEAWRSLQNSTGNGSLCDNYKFELPMSLRVGSLDALMVLSDELSRVNIMVEGVVNKIRRQAGELAPDQPLQVDNRPVASFMTNFHWDEAKYPLRKPLKEIVDELTESVSSVDDDLKDRTSVAQVAGMQAKTAEYQAIKQSVAAANRKTGGSLAVKDLKSVVKQDDIVDTENLATLIVTVPNYGVKTFTSEYETWADMVVPRSGKTVAEDGDYTLKRVVLFRRFIDDFKQNARTKGCQCRDIEKDEEKENGEKDAESAAARLAELQSSLESKRAEVATWCRTSYGEAFSAWVHICAVRLFVESVLRYGLPPQFLGALIQPGSRTEAKVRKALAAEFGGAGAQFWSAEEGSAATDGKDLYPYVSFTLDIDV